MAALNWSNVGFLIPTILLAISSPILAQTQLTATPENLTIAGTRGTPETRTLLIQASQPVNEINITPLDLDRIDGGAVLPASLIQVDLPAPRQSSVDRTLSVPLQFDLSRLSKSGEFSGSLLMTYDGGQLTVPITVRVKDNPWLPLLLLLAGVGLGTGLSLYRAEGKIYDESIVQVGQIRTQMRADTELAKPFAMKIEESLVDVETALANKQFDSAHLAVGNVQATWNKWRKGRGDWIAQLEYQRVLMDRLADLDSGTPYEQEVRVRLEDAIREAANQENPFELRKILQVLQQQINRYLQGRAQLDELNTFRDKATADRDEFWRQEISHLRQQLNQLSPESSEAFEQWQGSVETLRQKFVEELQQLAPRGGETSTTIFRGVENSKTQHLKPVPTAQPFSNERVIKASGRRLRLANFLSYGIVVGLLSIAGFNQLYLSNPTFGASLGDYFTLLAWGFGAEATSQSIAKVMRRWGLPGS